MNFTNVFEKNNAIENAMIWEAIQVIGTSPFGKHKGKDVVRLLRHWHAKHRIKFAPPAITPEERGTCINTPEKKEITINEQYRGNLLVTIPTLVHEASHALWPAKHYKNKDAALCDGAEDEYQAEVNEAAIYEWLRDEKGYPTDFELELRVKRLKDANLRSVVFSRITGKDDSACPPHR